MPLRPGKCIALSYQCLPLTELYITIWPCAPKGYAVLALQLLNSQKRILAESEQETSYETDRSTNAEYCPTCSHGYRNRKLLETIYTK